ncbi:RNA-directed DNA polymerase [Sulfurimonas lithotrophica]|uniref:RNA-directed DNA polymerase n=1 Tax=Sulfurimonas lithotrophica TaxID=2590022 RepID=A0A5P8P120_9BACT|nr:antiviral reverse transcriptase Drt3b [Sulfurimonas lithotrophica]QFR49379.1 RNA-directed DNA polymerase [Sulfurimonas lithotrophica]
MSRKFRKKQKITYLKERAVLSDTLPYETPAIFSNRYFYRFLVNNKVEIKNNEIIFDNSVTDVKEVLELLFNVKVDNNKASFENHERTIPFTFKIAHKKNDFRNLSLIHPLNQLMIVNFYSTYKESIKYFSNESEFSIRRPFKIAKNRYMNNYLKKRKNTKLAHNKIEIHDNEEEHLKSFFTYKKYSNIHRFFESYEYQRCEKKFDKLYKFDINKCFDSIYTHTIAWALLNKEIVKDNLNTKLDATFAGKFDKLMQNMNYGETNGILIGAEISRIFAELILQSIDKKVKSNLETKSCLHKTHYEIFRYVDDYFVFYDDERVKNIVTETFKHELKEYNLYVSDTKTIEFVKPIITDLTIAKTKITELINENFSYVIKDNATEDEKQWSVSLNSKDVITKFKMIIKETNIEYKDILNYSIATIEKRYLKIISKLENSENQLLYTDMFVAYTMQLLNFLFFIYSVSPRVTSTIKIVSLISKLIQFIKDSKAHNRIFKNYQIELIYKKMYDETFQILKKNKLKEYTQNETLYLLLILNEIGKDYRLESNFLDSYFFDDGIELNYFVIVSLLYYIKNISRYANIKTKLLECIENKFKSYNKDNLRKNTELTLLLMDLMTCPYVDTQDKNRFLSLNDVTDPATQNKIVVFSLKQKYWFVKWQDFNLAEEIELKKSQEVYS